MIDESSFPQPTTPRLTLFMSRTETIELWHPDSPGVRVNIRPCILRRLGVVRSEFATLGEVLDFYKRVEKHIRDTEN